MSAEDDETDDELMNCPPPVTRGTLWFSEGRIYCRAVHGGRERGKRCYHSDQCEICEPIQRRVEERYCRGNPLDSDTYAWWAEHTYGVPVTYGAPASAPGSQARPTSGTRSPGPSPTSGATGPPSWRSPWARVR